jgi:hypothetical protein
MGSSVAATRTETGHDVNAFVICGFQYHLEATGVGRNAVSLHGPADLQKV